MDLEYEGWRYEIIHVIGMGIAESVGRVESGKWKRVFVIVYLVVL